MHKNMHTLKPIVRFQEGKGDGAPKCEVRKFIQCAIIYFLILQNPSSNCAENNI